jgi:hypothetical protein
MNERIRELVLQAGEYVNSVYTPPVRSKTPGKIWEDGHVDWNEQFQAKFAELIIAECAQACMNEGASYEEKAAGAYQSNLYVTAIKKHFGVEE